MSKKLCLLISFVLVLSLSTLAQADAIGVNNPSFEFDVNCVNTVPGHTGYDGVCAWSYNYPVGDDSLGWVGVDVFCPEASGPHCHRWPGSDGGVVYSYLQNTGSNAYQVLDMNNSDANGIIIPGRKYTLTYDALGWGGDQHTASLFYVEEVCQPDVNHNELASNTYALVYIERDLGDCQGDSDLDSTTECPDWTYDLTVSFVAEAGADCIGKTLGIKIRALEPGDYTFVDNFRVEWSWASSAYDPDPPDEGEDVPIDVDLSWSPGLWAVGDVNGHEVYFGTSESEVADATTASDPNIYRGSGVGVVSGPDNGRYSYDALETLELGKTYYWRIDEVNENWASGPVPPVNDRWKGNVWSFTTTGPAYNIYPSDGAEGIPAFALLLRWAPGTGAATHDVYFGTSESEVSDANTASDPNIYRGNKAIDANTYPLEDLEVRKDYFWRIDEVNTNTGTFVKGDVWGFRTGVYLVVDSFDFYGSNEDLWVVWKDIHADTTNKAEIFIETDPNVTRSGRSMKFNLLNTYKNLGSYAEANPSDLEVASNDWEAGGVKAMTLYFFGEPCNLTDTTGVYGDVHQDQMWVALESAGPVEGVVEYDGDMSAITEEFWHEWNVDLGDFNDAGVTLSSLSKVYLGFGGTRIGQKKDGAGLDWGYPDIVYFDDIQLWPPRCMPAVTGLDNLYALGDFTGLGLEGTPDCNTNYLDLELMAEDWVSIDGQNGTENRPAELQNGPVWTTGRIGSDALQFDGVDDLLYVDDPRLFGLPSMTITAWVKHPIANSWVGVLSSREGYKGCGDDASEIGIYGKAFGGPDGLGYDWSCGTEEWQFDAGLDVPDMEWTFIAVSVDPTGATLHVKPDSESLTSARNTDAHDVQKNFLDHFVIGSDDKGGLFEGTMDDVRIYGYNLDDANIGLLANETGEPTPPPVYWYKFDDGTGSTTAADDGTPILVYTMNMSPANVVPKDPNESEDPNLGSNAFDPNNMDIVNSRDYAVFAAHWLEKHTWP